jgi:hypothetical protein
MTVYAVTPSGDTVRMCYTKNWDFNWQEINYYEKPILIPKNSYFIAEATFDNTQKNPHNPYNPPRDIYFNKFMTTISEMMDFYLKRAVHEPSDKSISQ